jgi:lactate permease
MNVVPTSFGAVGTPTWLGFGSLRLADSQWLEIGQTRMNSWRMA